MLKIFLIAFFICLSSPVFAQCGEASRPVANMAQAPYNRSFGIVGTPDANGLGQNASPPSAGTYHVCGNYMLKFDPGTTLETYHADSGLDPDNIDTAPAGGSSNGHHVPILGEALGSLIFVEPIGCRNITVNGTQHFYLHGIFSWSGTGRMIAGGALNWCKAS